MSDPVIPPRPATPQVLVHRLPDKSADALDKARRPSKFIILIMGSTAVAGKVQIASSVAHALSCPHYLGDSLHESSAKAASVGMSRHAAAAAPGGNEREVAADNKEVQDGAALINSVSNEVRYQRMWLSKMTRTGLLFPEESRPATEGFSGFGGTFSTSTSRRGSGRSVTSTSSNIAGPPSVASIQGFPVGSLSHPISGNPGLISWETSARNTGFTMSEEQRLRRANQALMVLTHPDIEPWHKLAIRNAVGEYGIGVIFVPLEEEIEPDDNYEDLPILQPVNPWAMNSFPTSFDTLTKPVRAAASLDREMRLDINVDANVEDKIESIVVGARHLMAED